MAVRGSYPGQHHPRWGVRAQRLVDQRRVQVEGHEAG
jgi:hypothetical protein